MFDFGSLIMSLASESLQDKLLCSLGILNNLLKETPVESVKNDTLTDRANLASIDSAISEHTNLRDELITYRDSVNDSWDSWIGFMKKGNQDEVDAYKTFKTKYKVPDTSTAAANKIYVLGKALSRMEKAQNS